MPPEATAPLMKAAGVDAGYGTMQVLWGVDLDVRTGETVLLLGANGAGKTTFLKSLVGLIEARHGHIKLGGEDITRMRSAERIRVMSSPPSLISPWRASIRPTSDFRNVVLPAPLAPSSSTVSPGRTSRSTPHNTCMVP